MKEQAACLACFFIHFLRSKELGAPGRTRNKGLLAGTLLGAPGRTGGKDATNVSTLCFSNSILRVSQSNLSAKALPLSALLLQPHVQDSKAGRLQAAGILFEASSYSRLLSLKVQDFQGERDGL